MIKPANPALAFTLESKGSTKDPEIALGVSPERSVTAFEELESMKRQLYGNRRDITLAEIFTVMSHVAPTPQEFALMCYLLGKTAGKKGYTLRAEVGDNHL